ncbi:hypothetical protein [Paenibacillus sp. DMB5]|nr:hypothetical protein [Paenibacillus sp. DMB5]
MSDIKKIAERQNLRLRILEDLYELYFSGGPEAFAKGRQEGLVGLKNEFF